MRKYVIYVPIIITLLLFIAVLTTSILLYPRIMLAKYFKDRRFEEIERLFSESKTTSKLLPIYYLKVLLEKYRTQNTNISISSIEEILSLYNLGHIGFITNYYLVLQGLLKEDWKSVEDNSLEFLDALRGAGKQWEEYFKDEENVCWSLLAYSYMQKERYQEAQEALTYVDKNTLSYYYLMSLYYFLQEDFTNSIKFADQGMKLAKGDENFFVILSLLKSRNYLLMGNYVESGKVVSNLINKGFTNLAEVYYILGRVYKARGELDLAQEQFKKALEINPFLPHAIFEYRSLKGKD